jgi:hypothetical protein
MKKYKFNLLSLMMLISIIASSQNNKSENFSIVAFGDMPYILPADYERFENLIKTVNEQDQEFNVHVGDIKASTTPCSEDSYQKIFNYFNEFSKPLIYTPGDNEWTDCDKKVAGSYDPEERLQVIRKTFFKDKSSFGKQKIDLMVQSDNPNYSKFVENRRWDLHRVTFGTVHLVGSNNFFLPESKNHNGEFFERDNANNAWLNEIFIHAKQVQSSGIVIFTQADMFTPQKVASGCFDRFLRELKKLTIEFKKPVILVNGDSHKFIVDKPFQQESTKKVVDNFTRIQVFGDVDIHAVKIIITPTSTSFFKVEQLLIPGN